MTFTGDLKDIQLADVFQNIHSNRLTGTLKVTARQVDRFVYFNCPENREHIRGKLAGLAIPFEEQSVETASLLLAFFERCLEYLEMELAGTVLAPGVTLRGEVRKREDYLREARLLGRLLAGRA